MEIKSIEKIRLSQLRNGIVILLPENDVIFVEPKSEHDEIFAIDFINSILSMHKKGVSVNGSTLVDREAD